MIDSLLDAMRFRCIGPPRGGRVVAVAGDSSEPAVFYFGAVAGGIWKTEDAGATWTNVSDGYLKTSAVGALAVSDADPSVVYAGMGESTIRTDVSHGDGVYRSTDRGRTWVHLGLADTRHISEIRIHPRDPDHVFVAALGHAFGPNSQRGVYRSTDGGSSWERVLYKDDRSGAADLALDAGNPTVLYASLWEVHRNFWELASGGPGSGLWRSTDGGTTWTEITSKLGLPASAMLGKIGVAASPARSGRVWALVESDAAPGLYRSDDFGETWTLASDRQDLRFRPWYYMHVFADSQDEDTVYVNNHRMWKSTDAGANFTQVPTPHGDNHDLWIDPRDNRRMIQGNDGGANVSYNAGASWSSIYNQLTAQLYTVDTDGRTPHYVVYGTQQDNSSIGVPSSTNDGAIAWEDCRIAGTGESGYVAVDPQRSRRRLRRRRRQLAGRHRGLAALRPQHGPGAARQRLARGPRRDGGGRAQVPFRVDLSDTVLSARPASALCRRQPGVPQHRRGAELGTDQPRSHPRGPGQARPVRRSDHPGHERGGALLHAAYVRRVPPRTGRAVGGVGRRAGAPEPGRRTELAQRDAARAAGMGIHPHRGALAARPCRSLSRRHPLQARRSGALSLQDDRLR